MLLKEIREGAKGASVKKVSRLGREDLIRAIQLAEGNTDCWQAIPRRGQVERCWREECQGEAQEVLT